jgi:hypothetical protein
MCAASLLFPVGSPSKVVRYTPSGLRGQCPQAGLWLLTCHITNVILIFRAASDKLWACRLWCWRPSQRWAWLVFRVLRSRIFLTVAVWIHYSFSYLIRRQQASPRNFTFHWGKLCCTTGFTKKLNCHKRNFCKTGLENAPSPCLTTVTQLPAVWYWNNILLWPRPFIPLTKCKTELTAQ